MTGTEIKRRKEYGIGVLDNWHTLETTVFLGPDISIEKKNLIEKKIDTLFDEVDAIMSDESDHTL